MLHQVVTVIKINKSINNNNNGKKNSTGWDMNLKISGVVFMCNEFSVKGSTPTEWCYGYLEKHLFMCLNAIMWGEISMTIMREQSENRGDWCNRPSISVLWGRQRKSCGSLTATCQFVVLFFFPLTSESHDQGVWRGYWQIKNTHMLTLYCEWSFNISDILSMSYLSTTAHALTQEDSAPLHTR